MSEGFGQSEPEAATAEPAALTQLRESMGADQGDSTIMN